MPAAADDGFEAFYAAYPRKVGKGHARKAYAAALKRGVTADRLLAAAQAYRDYHAQCRTEERFIPHPTTWLNGERYDDTLPAATPYAATGTDGWSSYRNPPNPDAYDIEPE